MIKFGCKTYIKNLETEQNKTSTISASVIDTATLKLNGSTVTKTAAQLNADTANPKQSAIADLNTLSSITGSDTVDAAAVLAALNALINKVNDVLGALRASNILNQS